MCYTSTTVFFLGCIVVVALGAPSARSENNLIEAGLRKDNSSEVEKSLEVFLNAYYDEYIGGRLADPPETRQEPEDDIYETMQGDQPAIENNINQNLRANMANFSGMATFTVGRSNFTDEYIRTMRNRLRKNDLDERSKENWIQFLKKNILEHLGRGNVSLPKHNDNGQLASINMSDIITNFLNSTNLSNDDQITEKIRSFYPSCEIPVNTDHDIWKDDDIMNLFFNFDYATDDRTNIATATLRLYRLPENGTQFSPLDEDCDNSAEDDKLLRVSIYWYTKSLKKRRVKRRLADSKVISEHSRWVELSVKPATKAWTRGRNLGLGVLVEDQEGNMLRADRYFKGASCMQRPNQSRPSSLTPPGRQTNLTEFIAYWEEIQRQPYIVIYNCYQP